MASPETARAAPAIAEGDPCKAVEAGRLNGSDNTGTDTEAQADKPLIDRGGRFYSRAILTAWSPAALAALDVRWRDNGQPARPDQ